MSSEDPPAYEPPGPEITGEPAADKDRGDFFADEPEKGDVDYNERGDPVKCNFTPLSIIILVILNLLAAGALGYLIWYAVDTSQNTDAPTRSPTPPPTPAPTRSMRPSNVPSVSSAPSKFSSSAPPTAAPTITAAPTPSVSVSPTNSPFSCNLCGPGKTMSSTNLGASVTFSARVTRTCQELLTDQNNGDILESQCIALYDSISTTCGCVATVGARDDTTITTLLRNTVGTSIDTNGSDQKTALSKLLDSATDTYFASAKATATDAEIIQRYLLILAYYQLGAEALLTSTLYAASECSGTWSSVTACEFGQITGVSFDSTVQTSASTPVVPSDLIYMNYIESISVANYAISSTIPSTLPTNDLLTSFALTGNKLSGSLPDALFELRSLTNLDLSDNLLTGDLGVKTKIVQLIRLTSMDLSTNGFTGTIPTCGLSTTPATLITDCTSEVACTCCSSCV